MSRPFLFTGQTVSILGIGGGHLDRRGRMSEPYVPGASIPGRMAEDTGGATLNALRAARRLGAACSLFSVRGGDAAGDVVRRALAASGIADLSAVFLDRATPTYTALLDADGDPVAALADMSLYDVGFPRQIRRKGLRTAVAEAPAVICDANVPEPALSALAAVRQGKALVAIAVSPAKVGRLRPLFPGLRALFLHRREAVALGADELGETACIDGLRRQGVRCAVVTQGCGPVLGFDDEESFAIETPHAADVADTTGAGDALAGVTTVALLGGLALSEAVRWGMAAARIVIASPAASPAWNRRQLAAALAAIPSARQPA